IKQRGLNPSNLLAVGQQDLSLFTVGPVLPPKDGTIIRGTTNKAVYLVSSGQIKLYSAYTFAQNKITPKQIVTVPDAEVATYSQNGFVAPKDGSLVKSPISNTVYLVQNSLKEPVTADVYKNQHYTSKQIATI